MTLDTRGRSQTPLKSGLPSGSRGMSEPPDWANVDFPLAVASVGGVDDGLVDQPSLVVLRADGTPVVPPATAGMPAGSGHDAPPDGTRHEDVRSSSGRRALECAAMDPGKRAYLG